MYSMNFERMLQGDPTADMNEVQVPWIPGSCLANTNEEPSRKRSAGVERRLSHNPELKEEYQKIVRDQLKEGIIEAASNT